MKIGGIAVPVTCLFGSVSAFSTTPSPLYSTRHHSISLPLFYADRQTDSFAAFADSLEEKPESDETWQERLESLLDPSTPLAQRQILVSELLSSNQDIRDSVSAALRDRKIDPLLTPTGKRLQDGTRAVARQLTIDILPSLAQAARSPPPPDLQAVPKIGSRILNAISNQAKKNFEELQEDIKDPTRIPQKLSRLEKELTKEAKNVFLGTPEGYQGPSYTVVSQKEGYEIREYQGYNVASTNMGKVGEPYSMNDISTTGTAFNALAAYLFGANEEGKAMEMTTPVTTTSLGEMRFFIPDASEDIPAPLEDASMYEAGAVQIVPIPSTRLAVRRFTGFVTEGEVARQKDVLLSQLQLDGVEIDVPHGAVVPHVIFQYNSPFTIPIVRRNEIAVPLVREDAQKDLDSQWGQDDLLDEEDLSPSDVE